MARELNEPELEDDYPIYAGYWYVADGKPVQSDWHGITARQLRNYLKAKTLCRCDITGRQAIAASNLQTVEEI